MCIKVLDHEVLVEVEGPKQRPPSERPVLELRETVDEKTWTVELAEEFGQLEIDLNEEAEEVLKDKKVKRRTPVWTLHPVLLPHCLTLSLLSALCSCSVSTSCWTWCAALWWRKTALLVRKAGTRRKVCGERSRAWRRTSPAAILSSSSRCAVSLAIVNLLDFTSPWLLPCQVCPL